MADETSTQAQSGTDAGTILTEKEPEAKGATLLTDSPADEGAASGEPKGQEPAKDSPSEPVQYEPFKLPEGLTVDDGYLAKFSDTAGKMQLSQAQAQSMVDLYTGMLAEMDASYQKLITEEWAKETRSHPTFAGDEGQARLRNVSRFVRAVASEMGADGEEFLQDLVNTGLGNRKSMALFMNYIVSKGFTADTVRGGRNAPGGAQNRRAADVMFDEQTTAYAEE